MSTSTDRSGDLAEHRDGPRPPITSSGPPQADASASGGTRDDTMRDRSTLPDRTQQDPVQQDAAWSNWDEPSGSWMLPGGCPDRRERTLVLEAAARLLFPTVLIFSVFLLLEGHYGPGGGFSGGLVAGLAFVLRHIAGGDDNLGSRFRVRPPVLVGSGLALAVLTGLAPMAWGAPILSSVQTRLSFGSFGYVDIVSSLLLDVGVYLLIIGVVLDLLRSLGSGIARDARDAGEDIGPGGELRARPREARRT